METPLVAVLAGSEADLAIVEEASKVLLELEVPHTLEVVAAYRTPERVREVVTEAEERGSQVFVCGASGAAHLAGLVAASTPLPVIGVPCRAAHLGGADALYATVQMPSGTPVATVGIDEGRNAGILAAQILAGSHPAVATAVRRLRDEQAPGSPMRREVGTGRDQGGLGFGFQPG